MLLFIKCLSNQTFLVYEEGLKYDIRDKKWLKLSDYFGLLILWIMISF